MSPQGGRGSCLSSHKGRKFATPSLHSLNDSCMYMCVDSSPRPIGPQLYLLLDKIANPARSVLDRKNKRRDNSTKD